MTRPVENHGTTLEISTAPLSTGLIAHQAIFVHYPLNRVLGPSQKRNYASIGNLLLHLPQFHILYYYWSFSQEEENIHS